MRTENPQPTGSVERTATTPFAATIGCASPIYQDAYATIYHGDNQELLAKMPACDLLLTDPPYGIDAARQRNGKTKPDERWAGRQQREYYGDDWDSEIAPDWMITLAREKAAEQIIWGGNYYTLPPARCWLIWDKENGENLYADCEMAWTNLDKPIRRIKYLWSGMRKAKPETRHHPTQKPLDVIAWALRQANDDCKTVLDPWMGSGTTLRAAKDAGMTAIGIERDEKQCEIAAKRLAQEVLAL